MVFFFMSGRIIVLTFAVENPKIEGLVLIDHLMLVSCPMPNKGFGLTFAFQNYLLALSTLHTCR